MRKAGLVAGPPVSAQSADRIAEVAPGALVAIAAHLGRDAYALRWLPCAPHARATRNLAVQNIFVINAHEEYEFSKGTLNATLADLALEHLKAAGYETRVTTMKDDWKVDDEIASHQWADAVLLQSPVNWMGVPWSFKKYMDFVYSFGMDGRLCAGDGRTRSDPSKQYGTGGTLTGKKYMLSLTLNAPRDSFDDPSQTFFGGMSLDDLYRPMHLNFKFFGMEALPTFACYDVMKNADVANDLVKYREHLAAQFPGAG
ncbi:MAG: NAD(P)H-dependent oxidoreductase [Myxococcota bacterium]